MLASAPPERAAAATDCGLTASANITTSNNPNQAGAVVAYSAPTTSGTCGTITCSPASGSFFPIGTTLVTCSASTTPVVKASFTIRIVDTQPPTITVPPNKTVSNDAGQASAAVTFAAPMVSDNAPGVTSACNHLSGSLFPLGTTTVTCTARDASGNTATASFHVIVNDTEPPVIERAPDVSATVRTNATGGIVSYTPPAAHDNSGANLSVACTPAIGSTFPVGSTTVTCSTTDPSGNKTTKSFSVVVTRDVAPQTELNNSRIKGRKATFRFSSAPGSHFECSIDKRAFKPCTSPARFAKLKLGKHVFLVRALDAADNADESPAIKRFRIRR